MRYNRKLDFRKLKPGNSLHNTIEICVVSVIVALYFYFMRGFGFLPMENTSFLCQLNEKH